MPQLPVTWRWGAAPTATCSCENRNNKGTSTTYWQSKANKQWSKNHKAKSQSKEIQTERVTFIEWSARGVSRSTCKTNMTSITLVSFYIYSQYLCVCLVSEGGDWELGKQSKILTQICTNAEAPILITHHYPPLIKFCSTLYNTTMSLFIIWRVSSTRGCFYLLKFTTTSYC